MAGERKGRGGWGLCAGVRMGDVGRDGDGSVCREGVGTRERGQWIVSVCGGGGKEGTGEGTDMEGGEWGKGERKGRRVRARVGRGGTSERVEEGAEECQGVPGGAENNREWHTVNTLVGHTIKVERSLEKKKLSWMNKSA